MAMNEDDFKLVLQVILGPDTTPYTRDQLNELAILFPEHDNLVQAVFDEQDRELTALIAEQASGRQASLATNLASVLRVVTAVSGKRKERAYRLEMHIGSPMRAQPTFVNSLDLTGALVNGEDGTYLEVLVDSDNSNVINMGEAPEAGTILVLTLHDTTKGIEASPVWQWAQAGDIQQGDLIVFGGK